MKNQLMRRTACLLLALLLLGAGAAAAQEKPLFSDVSESDWFYIPVKFLTSQGILQGYGDGTFRPGDTMTMAHFVKLLLAPMVPDARAAEGERWWKPYADYGEEQGILTRGDLLEMDQPILRNRVARILARLPLLPEREGAVTQVDRESILAELGDLEAIPFYDLEAVITVYGAGLMQGDDDGCFHPERTMSRAEGAMLIYRYLIPGSRTPRYRFVAPEDWFDDALLLGNSLCGGLCMYGELPGGDILYSSGGSVFGSPDGLYRDRNDSACRLWSRLREVEYAKIILIYGTNEMGYDPELFREQYEAFLDRLQGLQPEAEVWICTAPPVREALTREAELNNRNCRRANEVIRSVAEDRGLHLLDVWSLFADENGGLPSGYSRDGVHLNQEGCLRWTKWLRSAVLFC